MTDGATRPEPVDGGPRLLGNVPALDGLRGVAVLVVITFHGSLLMSSWHHRFLQEGGLGVDAFFVLSGFLITALLLREEATSGRVRLGRFYLRRALRLLPALVVLLGVHAIYASVVRLPASVERSSLFSVLFYYSNTGLRVLSPAEGLGHLWSLAVEEQFYVLWPLCFLFLGLRRKTSTVVVVMGGAIVAVMAYRLYRYNHNTAPLLLYIRTTSRADSLLVGALLAQLWVRRRVPTRGLTVAASLAAVYYAFLVANGAPDSFLYRGGFTLVAIAVAVMVLAILESGWFVGRLLGFGPLCLVGRVSYGLYIWHLAIFQAIVHAGPDWPERTRLAVGLSLTALACWLSWNFVERPFLRWKARLAPRGAAAPVAETVVEADGGKGSQSEREPAPMLVDPSAP